MSFQSQKRIMNSFVKATERKNVLSMLVRFTDTDCDVNNELAKKWGYRLISMPYIIDGRITYPYVDFDEFDGHAFYEWLRTVKELPTTCAISPEEYKKYFEPVFQEGNDILYVHFSAAMSGTFNAMRLAVDELLEKYPERRFYSLDTKAITTFTLFLLEDIALAAEKGATAEELIALGEKERDHCAAYFFADDLKFFAKSGRVSGLAGVMGGLLGIKPIITIGDDGKMASIGKVKGKPNALKYLMDKVEELGDHPEKRGFYIAHTDAPELVEKLKEMLREKYGADVSIKTHYCNPTIGIHCGPSCVGIAFQAKHR